MDVKSLSADLQNTLQSKLEDLQVVIIDEISMVSITMLKQIDFRLKRYFTQLNDLEENPFFVSAIFISYAQFKINLYFNQVAPNMIYFSRIRFGTNLKLSSWLK